METFPGINKILGVKKTLSGMAVDNCWWESMANAWLDSVVRPVGTDSGMVVMVRKGK